MKGKWCYLDYNLLLSLYYYISEKVRVFFRDNLKCQIINSESMT